MTFCEVSNDKLCQIPENKIKISDNKLLKTKGNLGNLIKTYHLKVWIQKKITAIKKQ